MRILASIGWALALVSHGQVNVDRPVLLTGAGAGERQVLGLDSAVAPSQALDAATDQRGAAHWAGDGTGAAWDLSLPALASAPAPGLALVVRIAAPQSGPVTLTLNGNGPFPVVLGPNEPLQGDAFPVATTLALIFDGTAFQVTNGVVHQLRPCPSGTVAVGTHSCVEMEERPLGTWFQAAVSCATDGLRLCTWSEWQQACLRRVELGLNTMIGNWEWVNNTANEDGNARVVGNTSCANSATSGVTVMTAARCCYSR
jgi:hypothetical protein